MEQLSRVVHSLLLQFHALDVIGVDVFCKLVEAGCASWDVGEGGVDGGEAFGAVCFCAVPRGGRCQVAESGFIRQRSSSFDITLAKGVTDAISEHLAANDDTVDGDIDLRLLFRESVITLEMRSDLHREIIGRLR